MSVYDGSTLFKVFEILLISLWILILVPLFFNIYHYLYKQGKYRFVPMVLVYVGLVCESAITVAYHIERIDADSRINTHESTWIYFSANMRLACLVSILGYGGLLIELNLKLRMLQQCSA